MYKVVKFIVNVKLIENNVKSHVGNVMLAKVASQSRAPSMALTKTTTTRPNAFTELLDSSVLSEKLEPVRTVMLAAVVMAFEGTACP